ncbi:hypothetical protein GGR53DRAFT_510851 [Hypoxylon sp. FL1150]|nr:hypothetical protein GGR53DRAFT_510851 [Hypoxylon sp. FL1150]
MQSILIAVTLQSLISLSAIVPMAFLSSFFTLAGIAADVMIAACDAYYSRPLSYSSSILSAALHHCITSLLSIDHAYRPSSS